MGNRSDPGAGVDAGKGVALINHKQRKPVPNDITNAERDDFMQGQIHALRAFALAVITTHPSPDNLIAEFEQSFQLAMARVVGSPVWNSYLDGADDTAQRIRHFASIVQGLQK